MLRRVPTGVSAQVSQRTMRRLVELEAQVASLMRAGGRIEALRRDVLVRNESGANRGQFAIFGLDDILISRSDFDLSHFSTIAFRGVVPDESKHRGRFAIMLDPTVANGIGRACISGVCHARVQMAQNDAGTEDLPHTHADILDGVTGRLQSAPEGGVELLWIEPREERTSPTIARCIVRFGGAPQGGVSVVKLRRDDDGGDGALGDLQNKATITYSIYSIDVADVEDGDAVPLAEELTPQRERTALGRYRPAEPNTLGLAIVIEDEWVLLVALGEQFEVSVCQPDG